jgi:cytochrome b561
LSEEEDWADPCQEFAHSVLFFLIVVVACIGWIVFGYTSFKT